MASALVERATSDMLFGPDWAMNGSICDILNREPGQARDVAKDLRRRICSRNPKVQLLALTLLETMIKNCGDIVHMHVAEKDVLHKMVKIANKKHADPRVREKILILIDTWRENFGGTQARYPQYYVAYQELLRAGAIFPPRSERSAPKFTQKRPPPPQSSSPSLTPGYKNEKHESSVISEFPVFSLAEIQNAHGVVDVLGEMLNAMDPEDREGLKEDVIVDLVNQCRSYRQRVVHLVNTTSNEELLSQGLALNDDLQKVLEKHDAVAAGISANMEKRKSLQALVDIDDSSTCKESDERLSTASVLVNTLASSSATSSSNIDPNMDLLSGFNHNKPSTADQLALVPADEALSSSNSDENRLALVPAGEPLANSTSDENRLVPADMFLINNSNTNPANSIGSVSTLPQQMYLPGSNFQLPAQQHPFLSNGGIQSSGSPGFELTSCDQELQLNQKCIAWNGRLGPAYDPYNQALRNGFCVLEDSWSLESRKNCLSPSSSSRGVQSNYSSVDDRDGALPPPPWEIQPVQNEIPGLLLQQLQNGQHGGTPPEPLPAEACQLGGMPYQHMPWSHAKGMYPQHISNTQHSAVRYRFVHGNQFAGVYPPLQNSQMTAMYLQQMHVDLAGGAGQQYVQGSQLLGRGYGQPPDAQFYNPMRPAHPYSAREISESMYELSVQDNRRSGSMSSSYRMPTSQQLNEPLRPEDKLFSDLVDMAKTKTK